MPKIPNIKRFKGDHEISFTQWKLQFEAQLSALGIEDDLKIQMLLCCTESSAFTFISQTVANQEDIAYEDLVQLINDRFSGED